MKKQYTKPCTECVQIRTAEGMLRVELPVFGARPSVGLMARPEESFGKQNLWDDEEDDFLWGHAKGGSLWDEEEDDF